MSYEVRKSEVTTYFTASMMSQITPVNLEFAMIIHVYQLMRQRILHVLLTEKVA